MRVVWLLVYPGLIVDVHADLDVRVGALDIGDGHYEPAYIHTGQPPVQANYGSTN